MQGRVSGILRRGRFGRASPLPRPSKALNHELLHVFLGIIVIQGRFQGLHRDLHACRALVPSRAPVAAEGLDRDGAAILAVAVPAQNDDEPVPDDAGNQHIKNLRDPDEKIGHLDAGVGAFHLAEKAHDPVAIAAPVMKGIVVVLEIFLGDLIQLDAANELAIGAGIGQVIGGESPRV